jgi:hypothetical protein
LVFAASLQPEVNLALLALESVARHALLTEVVLVDIVACEGNKSNAVRYELVVQRRGVLAHFHQVDGHRGYLSDDDPPECVCDRKVSVEEHELDGVLGEFEDLDLWFSCEALTTVAASGDFLGLSMAVGGEIATSIGSFVSSVDILH